MAHSFSNGVIETLTVKCKSIKTISVTIYSPPNSCCNLREWSDGMTPVFLKNNAIMNLLFESLELSYVPKICLQHMDNAHMESWSVYRS